MGRRYLFKQKFDILIIYFDNLGRWSTRVTVNNSCIINNHNNGLFHRDQRSAHSYKRPRTKILLLKGAVERAKLFHVSRRPIPYRMAQKLAPFLYALTLPNINRFSKLFHCQNQEKICNNTITKSDTLEAWRDRGIFSDSIITNFLLILIVK